MWFLALVAQCLSRGTPNLYDNGLIRFIYSFSHSLQTIFDYLGISNQKNGRFSLNANPICSTKNGSKIFKAQRWNNFFRENWAGTDLTFLSRLFHTLHVTLLYLPTHISITPTYMLLYYTYLHITLLYLPTQISITPTDKDIYYTYLQRSLLYLPTQISITPTYMLLYYTYLHI